MKIVQTTTTDIDLVKERKRLKTCFYKRKALYKKLSRLVDEFERGNWDAAIKVLHTLGYDEKNECRAVEYVWPEIFDALLSYQSGGTIYIEKRRRSG